MTVRLAARMTDNRHTRRAVIAGLGAGGLAVTLAACGGDSTDTAAAQPSQGSPSSPAPQAAGGSLTTTSEIPVGGAKVFKEQKVVVAQPTEGQFKAFSAACTHQGCTVADASNGQIVCPCHGSAFAIADGSVLKGPATKPLPEQPIKVEGDSISLA
ncbi:Rieske (2Fe-2S) protein [Thermoactinospora rubra]|uniref:Rieske (2Fe-2S) protein n=1 Tax=Thermoactinospora rubra TaxID=1088767 RepID=UPI001F0A940A|nr:Rieske (2Fe-2S) protein [Thermoactinospora rubra]